MRPQLTRFVFPALLSCAGLLVGCAPHGDPSPAATLDGQTIHVGELDTWIKQQLWDQATGGEEPAKLHALRLKALDSMINQRLVEAAAKSRGVDADTLLKNEAQGRIHVSEADIQHFYDKNRTRMGGHSLAEAREQIQAHLERQQSSAATRAFLQELRQKANVEVLLPQPRVKVAADGPAEGPADAPITIIEFSDFQCPYCRRAEPILEQVMQHYPGKIRLVYRHFPLGIHPLAEGAALAAVCADRQGHFWDYHQRLFAKGADLKPAGLLSIATELGMDPKAWQTCTSDQATRQKVASDIQAGHDAGVTGTPAFFINGIPLKGALPMAEFTRVIDGELAKAG